jgi:hypothetical protein
VTETRTCAQCAAVFVPRREHARFCASRCRAAWNRERAGDPAFREAAAFLELAAAHVRSGMRAGAHVRD